MNKSLFLSLDKTMNVDEVVKQYQFQRKFADRRKDLYSARTYIYEGEEKCDENRDVFLDCIETTGKHRPSRFFRIHSNNNDLQRKADRHKNFFCFIL